MGEYMDDESIGWLFSDATLDRYTEYYIPEYFRYATLYVAFMFLNFYVMPKLIRRESFLVNGLLFVAPFLLVALAFGSVDSAFPPLMIFIVYYGVKYAGLYLWFHAESMHAKYRFLAPGTLLTVVLWLISLVFLLIGEAEIEVIIAWVTLIPFGIFLYSYSFYSLIPNSIEKKRPFLAYVWRVVLVLLLSVLPLMFFTWLITNNDDLSASIVTINAFLQLLVTVPFSWILYRRFTKGNEEISSLKKELGQSAASIDFLRSQINPHFLFNALNTLYGTALQENASRTSEGIQRLGDMMRFMLQENMQEKISLAREIEYLNNYIDLQKLRTDTIPSVQISAEIEQPVSLYQISPMLLIPFVENAFKHGISFREPSHIKISLEVRDGTLYFDVENSRHDKIGNDPERNNSGIGLNNVKQRLALLYPNKHRLIIHETAKKFFIHLTIQLT